VERIRALVNRAGAPVRDVCSLDFSRRTAEANAAVIGLGRSRRVVIADTLLAEFTPGEVDAVVAHELGHHVHRDVQRLLLGNAVLMWLGLFVAARLSPVALPVLSLPSLAYVPGYPAVFCLLEQRPPRWSEVLLASHPALHRRIRVAESWGAAG